MAPPSPPTAGRPSRTPRPDVRWQRWALKAAYIFCDVIGSQVRSRSPCLIRFHCNPVVDPATATTLRRRELESSESVSSSVAVVGRLDRDRRRDRSSCSSRSPRGGPAERGTERVGQSEGLDYDRDRRRRQGARRRREEREEDGGGGGGLHGSRVSRSWRLPTLNFIP